MASPLTSADDEALIEEILARLTLREKLGQMMQPDWRTFRSAPKLSEAGAAVLPAWAGSAVKRALNAPLTDEQCDRSVGRHCLGSVLGGGGACPTPNEPLAWQAQAAAMQRAALRASSGLPLLVCNDSANLRDATLFPHHIGQGCMRDEGLVEELGALAARESAACGINWIFSPCAAVALDLRWGRTYESFSEDPALCGRLSAAEVRGIQRCGLPMAACAKHWVADGGTALGTGKFDMGGIGKAAVKSFGLDQGNADCDDAELRATHVAPYLPALAEGVLTVMVSYSSLNGVKCHASRALVTGLLKEELGHARLREITRDAPRLGLLKEELGFRGVVGSEERLFGDLTWRRQLEELEAAVGRGDVPAERVDDAVRRVLRVKVACGLLRRAAASTPAGGDAAAAASRCPLFDAAVPPMGDAACVGCEAHRAAARRAVAKSCVLLVNEGGLLPLPAGEGGRPAAELLVTGIAADSLGRQCGGWSLEWQGCEGNAFTTGTTIADAIRAVQPGARLAPSAGAASRPVAVVVTGEAPYAEGFGDVEELRLPPADVRAAVALADAGWAVVLLLVTGRPLLLPPPLLSRVAAVLVAWLPGTEGDGVADVLFGRAPATGRLSFSWPHAMDQAAAAARLKGPLFPFGHGLQTRAVG
ncbi:hypothetical protein EMIHUDRAFT_105012 [Emiliania huxleyi CCMP1516]|uniref:beta-glucosidase n=2 Tax=Emiliania huxleyi TaxID=2903 RepID=A0A0D3II51_EMIH1|nr:hypothetical protein EMIHUDRAFT_105012 [Emiliania huxleyi CCMP1516]EOD10936.1 hypothetical protein EMIHUDRAFT_105012 [Emiliania huxleyi CCMP1516]|eukprot:XP_005763365.1 hypothetical protein EMIHUDRAFT_105012 [Emiliania huxleyi CCMP1516]